MTCILMIINLWFLMTVPVVNEPGHLIKFRPEEVRYFLFCDKTNKNFFTLADSKEKKNGTVLIKFWPTKLPFYRQTLFFFHCIKGLSFSIPKQIFSTENRDCQIEWNTTTCTVTDHVPLYPSLAGAWSICIPTKADDSSTRGRACMMEFM